MTWTSPKLSGPPPLPRSLHSASLIGSRMYIFGGWVPYHEANESKDWCPSIENNPNQPPPQIVHEKEWRCTNTMGVLDLETLTWVYTSQEADNDSAPKARAGHCAVPVSTRLYIWSGRDGYKKAANKNQVCYNDLWYLETEPPSPPSKPALIRANVKTLEVYWNQLANADFYIIQVMLFDLQPAATASPGVDDIPQQPEKKAKLENRPEKDIWYYAGIFTNNHGIVSNLWVPKEGAKVIDEKMIDTKSPPKFQENNYEKTDLEPGTVYKLRLCGVNACGLGPWSEVANFKTCVPGFPGAPSAIKISKIPEGGISMTWTPPQGDAEVIEYFVYLAVKRQTASNNAVGFVKVYSGEQNACSIAESQLSQACTQLDGPLNNKPSILFRLAARNSKGVGPSTQVRWLQDAKPAPTPPSATSATTTPTSTPTPTPTPPVTTTTTSVSTTSTTTAPTSTNPTPTAPESTTTAASATAPAPTPVATTLPSSKTPDTLSATTTTSPETTTTTTLITTTIATTTKPSSTAISTEAKTEITVPKTNS